MKRRAHCEFNVAFKQRGIRESEQNLYSHFSSDQSRTHLRLTGEQQKREELQSEPSLRADNQFSKDLSITLKFDHRNNSLKVPGAFRNAQQSPGQTHWCSDRGRTSLPAKKKPPAENIYLKPYKQSWLHQTRGAQIWGMHWWIYFYAFWAKKCTNEVKKKKKKKLRRCQVIPAVLVGILKETNWMSHLNLTQGCCCLFAHMVMYWFVTARLL